MKLSHREHTVLTLIACGLTDKETAEKLKISPRTVEKHMASVILKLNAKNRVNAAILYMRLNPNWKLKIRYVV